MRTNQRVAASPRTGANVARFARLLLAVSCAFGAAAPARAQGLQAAQQIPAARTLGYVEVSDCAQGEAALKSTDLGQVCDSLTPFFDTLVDGLNAQMAEQKGQFQKEFGVKADDAIAVLKGGFALAVVDTAPAGGEPQPAPVAFFPAAAKKTISALLETLKRKQQGNRGGMPPLHLVDRPGLCCIAIDQNALAPQGTTLDKDPQFMAVRAKVVGAGQPLFLLYANVAGLVERALAGGAPPDAKQKLDAAGVTSVKAAGLAVSCEGGQLRESFFLNAPGDAKGFLKVVASSMKPLDVAKIAERTPGEAFFAARFDLGVFLDETLALVKAIEPKATKDIDEGLKKFEKDSGFKVHGDLLDPWGDTWTVETFAVEAGLLPDTVFTVTVKDGARLQQTLARLAQKGGFEVAKITRGGHEIRYLRAPLGEFGETGPREMDPQMMQALGGITGSVSAWTLDGDRMYFAALPQSIEARFEAIQKGNLGGNAAFKQALPQMAGARIAAFSSLKPVAGALYQVGLKVLRMFEPAIRRAGVAVDTTLLPRAGGFASAIKPSTMVFTQDQDGLSFSGSGGMTALVAVPVVAIIAAIAVPNLIEARKGANEAAAIGAMRTLSTAQALHKQRQNEYAADLMTLGQAQFIDAEFARGMKNGYMFRIVTTGPEGWSAVAVPLEFGKSGDRSFFVDQTGQVRFSYGGEEPTADSPPIGG